MTYFDGTMGTGGEGQQFFLLSISKNILHLMIQMIILMGAWGQEHGDGGVGKGAWGWHHGNGTMGTARSERQQFFLLSVSKKILHRMIEMIYFDGSKGKGGEGQPFFYYLFQKIFYSL